MEFWLGEKSELVVQRHFVGQNMVEDEVVINNVSDVEWLGFVDS